jgi:hypothetical protein
MRSPDLEVPPHIVTAVVRGWACGDKEAERITANELDITLIWLGKEAWKTVDETNPEEKTTN